MVEIEVIPHSPANSLKQKAKRENVDRQKAITKEELRLMMMVAFGDKFKDALLSFIADTGCRSAGAAGLQKADLDLAALRAFVTEKGNKKMRI